MSFARRGESIDILSLRVLIRCRSMSTVYTEFFHNDYSKMASLPTSAKQRSGKTRNASLWSRAHCKSLQHRMESLLRTSYRGQRKRWIPYPMSEKGKPVTEMQSRRLAAGSQAEFTREASSAARPPGLCMSTKHSGETLLRATEWKRETWS